VIWARTDSTPVTTDRRVRVFNSYGQEGWVAVIWGRGGVKLDATVIADDGATLDGAAEIAAGARHLPPLGPFHETLAALRTAAGLSVPDLARKSGLSDDTLRRWEAGDPKRLPTWEAVQKLAAALGVPTDTFRDTPGA
jgi:DNA-binding XRE family transcriptional regulator